MTGFTGLGQDIAAAAKACASNMNAPDMAAFLAAQQDIIQEQAIKDRLEGKAPGQGAGGGKPGGGQPKEANEAYARLKAAAAALK